MVAKMDIDWKKKTPAQILESALPSELLVAEINPEFSPDEDDEE